MRSAYDISQVKHVISAIVVTHNAASLIRRCLESLMLSSCTARVAVIDNASEDDTCQIVGGFENVALFAQANNLGFARANNIGISWALRQGSDFVLLLNQDAVVSEHTLEILVNCAESNPDFGILSPLHLTADGTTIDPNFGQYVLEGASEFVSDLYFARVKQVYPIHFVNAAAWLLTRRCLESVGGFDPLFFMYGEDDDLCRRAEFHGFRIGIVPSAIAFHARAGSVLGNGGRWRNLATRSNRFYSAMVAFLKQPFRSFSVQSLLLANDIVSRLADLGSQRDRQGLAALALATGRITVCYPRIWLHRRLARRPGTHWIHDKIC